jgi:MscS family membrane protein
LAPPSPFAAKESLENLIASFIIFFDKPFITGDLLKVNNVTGRVEKIGLRSTRIRTTDKTFGDSTE